MRWRVAAAGVLALVSCGGSDESTAPADTFAPLAPPPPSEPDPVPATDVVDSTTTSADLTSTDLTSTTTTSTTTTIDPAEALAAEVEADYREAERLRIRAARDPNDPDRRDAALRMRLGENRSLLRRTLDDLKRRGRAVRPSQTTRPSHLIENGPTFPATDEAVIQRCEIDPWLVVEVGAGPNGSDAIVDDNVYAYRNHLTLRLIDGTWRIATGVQLGRWTGVTECPPESSSQQ